MALVTQLEATRHWVNRRRLTNVISDFKFGILPESPILILNIAKFLDSRSHSAKKSTS